MDMFSAQACAAGIVTLGATVEDIARRSISNWFAIAALVAGVGINSFYNGWRGAGSALLGFAGGGLVFILFYLLGGMGGGDVKLMAGLGSLVGWSRLFVFAFWTAIAGGILAGIVLAAAKWRSRNQSLGEPASRLSIPYAPAISLGLWLTLLSAQAKSI